MHIKNVLTVLTLNRGASGAIFSILMYCDIRKDSWTSFQSFDWTRFYVLPFPTRWTVRKVWF